MLWLIHSVDVVRHVYGLTGDMRSFQLQLNRHYLLQVRCRITLHMLLGVSAPVACYGLYVVLVSYGMIMG
jgi:hypothetical protein